jgi:membrane protease YdiL (CAAX protease family)
MFFIAGTVQSQMPLALFMLSTLALSVILADLFWRSGESILPALAMHTSINAFAGVIPTMPHGGDARAYALTVALLVVVAAVTFWAEGRRARIPVGAGPPAIEGASHDGP